MQSVQYLHYLQYLLSRLRHTGRLRSFSVVTFISRWQWATLPRRDDGALSTALSTEVQHSALGKPAGNFFLVAHFTLYDCFRLDSRAGAGVAMAWTSNSNVQQTRRAYLQHTISDTAQHTVSTAYNIKTSSAPSLTADPQSISLVIQATDTTRSTHGWDRG